MDKNKVNNHDKEPAFYEKVWIVCGIVALSAAIIWFFTITFSVFLLILAGALIALFFHGFSELLHRKLQMPSKLALVVSVFLTFVVIGIIFWFTGDRVQHQVSELSKSLPLTISNAKQQLSRTDIGQKIIDRVSTEDIYAKAYSFGGSFFNSTFGAFGDLYVVIFLGIFFTFAPSTYINGFLCLMPPRAKPVAKATIVKLGYTLTKWLKGQLFAMVIIFVLTAIGLTIVGMPMAIALALIAGLLNFIPNFGPLLAMIPAVLIALTRGINDAVIVAALYILVQILESNIITPNIQRKLINIPPALTILAQLFMGILSGGWGLVLATPLVAIVIIIVGETYVKRINNRLSI